MYEPDPETIKAKYRAAEEEARAHHYDSTKEGLLLVCPSRYGAKMTASPSEGSGSISILAGRGEAS